MEGRGRELLAAKLLKAYINNKATEILNKSETKRSYATGGFTGNPSDETCFSVDTWNPSDETCFSVDTWNLFQTVVKPVLVCSVELFFSQKKN